MNTPSIHLYPPQTITAPPMKPSSHLPTNRYASAVKNSFSYTQNDALSAYTNTSQLSPDDKTSYTNQSMKSVLSQLSVLQQKVEDADEERRREKQERDEERKSLQDMIRQQNNQMQQQTQKMQQQSDQIQQLINAININQPTVPMNVQVDPAQSLSQITPANSNSATSPQAKQNDSTTATTVSTNNSSLKLKADIQIDKLNDDSWTPTNKPLNNTNQQ